MDKKKYVFVLISIIFIAVLIGFIMWQIVSNEQRLKNNDSYDGYTTTEVKKYKESEYRYEEKRTTEHITTQNSTNNSVIKKSTGSTTQSHDPDDYDIDTYYEDHKDEFEDEDDAWDDFEDNEGWEDY